jgi:hypothetical protein
MRRRAEQLATGEWARTLARRRLENTRAAIRFVTGAGADAPVTLKSHHEHAPASRAGARHRRLGSRRGAGHR